jgi:hypothetical protein
MGGSMTSKKRAKAVNIGDALIWAAVLIATALLLADTPGVFAKLLPVLGGGAGGSAVVLSTLLAEEKCEAS